MRAYAIYTIAIGLSLFAAGCTKDGKFNPSEKISKVYSKTTRTVAHLEENVWTTDTTINVAKHMTEEWFWDGKQLAAIAYYDADGRVERTVKFEYDGIQLAKAYADADNYIELTYDGRKVTGASSHVGGRLYAEYQFTHDGSKISQIEISYPSINEGMKTLVDARCIDEMLWQVLMPCDARIPLQSAAKGGSKAPLKLAVSLTWEGKNVSAAEVESNGLHYTTTYTYDENHNPYQGFLYALVTGGEATPLAKNNVLTATLTAPDDVAETTAYTYAYDGKWPIARGCGHTVGDISNRTSDTEMLYFEYAD